MSPQQITIIRFTQKQLQNIMRESCELNGINDNAIIQISIDTGSVTISHPPHVLEPMPEEPVNDANCH